MHGQGRPSLPGLDHLVLLGQIDPELETPQIAFCDLGHLAVDNTPPSSHPLDPSRANNALQDSKHESSSRVIGVVAEEVTL